MGREIELKLSIPPAARDRLLRLPLLTTAHAGGTAPFVNAVNVVNVVNVYYDTPKLALHRRAIALRLRKKGNVCLQTVKCAGDSAAGLSSRPEWETPYTGHFDFAHIEDEDLRTWLSRPKLTASLAPVFETNFERASWRLERNGSVVMLAVDRGTIAASGREEAISEVELELESGEAAQLFTLARELAAKVPLLPQPLSKAERGYRLYQALAIAAVKFRAPTLAADTSPLQAYRALALACLEHLQANVAGALASDDPEFIHQMRVAVRRLRSCLRLFESRLPADVVDAFAPLAKLMQLLAAARDLDVILAQIVVPVAAALPEERHLTTLITLVRERQTEARDKVRKCLRSASYGRMLLAAMARLHEAPFNDAGGESGGLGHFASRRLKRLKKKVLRRAEKAASAHGADARALHRLRIAIKRLRYALEFFAPLASSRKSRHASQRLAELQDDLGALNDLADAGPTLAQCAGSNQDLREAMALVAGWHAERHAELLAEVGAKMEKLRHLELPALD